MKTDCLDRLEQSANSLVDERRVYAGMGASNAPASISVMLTEVASALFRRGWTLRSGGALGADLAFEEGAADRKETFFPKDATAEAHAIAERFHPEWHKCSTFTKNLLARKSLIILGADLNSPVSFLICWTADGGASGGTGQAIRLARGYGIPVHNLFDCEATRRPVDRIMRRGARS